MSTIMFEPFPKIPRMRRQVAVTEKIDGTNAAVRWEPLDEGQAQDPLPMLALSIKELTDQHGTSLGPHMLFAQSRSKFITPNADGKANDNYGFAAWVKANADDLTKLGPGSHFGEWWGYGIQRGYIQQRKRFSLFNVNRWGDGKAERPACCDVVPLLGYVEHDGIQPLIDKLRTEGSVAAPGFMMPEGVVIYHTQSKQLYKILLDGDEMPKGVRDAA